VFVESCIELGDEASELCSEGVGVVSVHRLRYSCSLLDGSLVRVVKPNEVICLRVRIELTSDGFMAFMVSMSSLCMIASIWNISF